MTPQQVQAIWLKEVVAGDTLPFPQDAARFRDALVKIVNTLKDSFPNLRLIYVSSRIYGGYALRNGSKEPWAYEGGFAYKWMKRGGHTSGQMERSREVTGSPGTWRTTLRPTRRIPDLWLPRR